VAHATLIFLQQNEAAGILGAHAIKFATQVAVDYTRGEPPPERSELAPLKCFGFAPLVLAWITHAAIAAEIAERAERVVAIIDALQVEDHWPAGVHVNWETGVPDGQPEHGMGKHTHCSAFVAAAAKRLGIYILRPPEHPQLLLANAQVDWLAEEGVRQGWRAVESAVQAQHYANRGYFVVAAYHNHYEDKPGHIAIIRPSEKSVADVESEGPQITQAGGTNYRSATLRQGFAGHPAAWGSHEVRYYAHAVDDSRLSAH